MDFPAEHLLDKLQISANQLTDFEWQGIVQGIAKAGRVFYSSRDMYRLKGILVFLARGVPLEEVRWRVDHPTREVAGTENRGIGTEKHRDGANE